jgi:hypothetical protein
MSGLCQKDFIRNCEMALEISCSSAHGFLTMDALDYWRLCDYLSVVQIALLIVGEDPSQFQGLHRRAEPTE